MLRYGIIGCGMMGREHIRNIGLIEGVEVAAYFEPDGVQAMQASALVPDAVACPDLETLVARDDLDALVIASPNNLHVAQLRALAAARPRPVLVEKPVFTKATERSALLDLAKVYAAPIWVAMEYRYMPPMAAFLREVNDATGGVKMLSIREHRFPFLHKVGHWNRFNAATGGTLVEKCCHFFDLMRLVMGTEPVRIMASGGQAVNHLDECYDDGVPDVWDNAFVVLEFPGGARAMLELCMFAEGARFQEDVSAIGPAGKIETRVPGPTRFWPSNRGPAPVPELEISPRRPIGPILRDIPVDPVLLQAGDHNGATYYQHQKFAEVVAGRGTVEVTLQDGIRAVDLGLAAQQAAQEGRTLALSPEISSA